MVKKLNIVAVVQARLTSKRFPKKVISKIGNYSLIEIIKKRLDRSKLLDKVVYAIPKNQENKNLEIFLKQKNIEYHSGSEKNVLKRYIQTAIKFDADIIVRITSDCPLVCPKMLDNMIHEFKKKKVDYLSNIKDPLNTKDEFYYPDGFDIEIFSKKSLLSSYKKISSSFDCEHVTTFIRSSNIFKKHFVKSQKKLQKLKLSVDTKKDLNNVKKIFKVFASNIFFSFEDILKNKKSLDIIKKQTIRKNMLSKKVKKSQSLWSKANKIIPGGNMLLSKNPDRYLPKLWPTYFKNADGCNVTDLDNNKYIDFSTMGVGTNVLGYGNTSVDNAVKNTIKKGNLSTLNCPEEVYLAEKLIEIHPWFDMVKFARTGGEANSIAIRIARVASARDNVAVCGYHGWHDWYLSTNLNKNKKNNLDQHLMKNLQISGVPKKLKNTVFSFHYGDFITLKNLVNKKKLVSSKWKYAEILNQILNF